MAPKRQRVAVVMPLYRGPAALPVGSSSEEKLATMNQRLQDLRDIRLSAQTIAIYRGTFQAYANWCNFFDVPSLPINRLVLLRMIDVKCDDNDNATSAHMWVSQTYSYARFAFGAPLLTTDDALFWHDIYPGLYKEYGKHKFSPPALGAKELLKIYDTTQPDPRKDLPLWINWLHILFAYHATMRPNEHTGKDCEAVVRNVHFLDNNEGLRYHFPATKGTRMAHLSDGENTYVRSVIGPLDVVNGLRQYFAIFRLEEKPEHSLFPSITAAGHLTHEHMSNNEFNTILRNLSIKSGITMEFTARCLRAGHRTDLRNSGVPPDIVNLLGRWKSESSSAMYQRTTEAIVPWLPQTIGGRVF